MPCSAVGVQKPVALPESGGSEQRHRLQYKFYILQPEGGDALPLQADDAAAIMKKISTISGCAELNLYGKVNPSGIAGRTGFPGAYRPTAENKRCS